MANNGVIRIDESIIQSLVAETLMEIARESGRPLNEAVFADKESLRYNDGTNWRASVKYDASKGSKKNSLSNGDYLSTAKMDKDDSDVHVIPLKGGIQSYHITGIYGTEIMHFFKRRFTNEATSLNIDATASEDLMRYVAQRCGRSDDIVEKTLKKKEGETEANPEKKYQVKINLTMEDDEFNVFYKRFMKKMNIVISDFIAMKEASGAFSRKNLKVYLYPVPSSSNFNNQCVADYIVARGAKVGGHKILRLDGDILEKSTKNIRVDDDFLEQHKDWYNTPFFKDQKEDSDYIPDVTGNDFLKKSLYSFRAINEVMAPYVDEINKAYGKVIYAKDAYRRNPNRQTAAAFIDAYKTYAIALESMTKMSLTLYDPTLGREAGRKVRETLLYKEVGGLEKAQAQAVKLCNMIHQIEYNDLKTYNGQSVSIKSFNQDQNGQVSPGETIEQAMKGFPDIDRFCKFMLPPFEIKKLSNPIRMVLRDMYTKNLAYGTDNGMKDASFKNLDDVKANIKDSLIIIFDDNISGGATLADVALQFKDSFGLSADQIMPITFGKMGVSNRIGQNNIKPLKLDDAHTDELAKFRADQKAKEQAAKKNTEGNGKKKVGRPRKNPVATTEPVVAAAPRKRGRPRKNPEAPSKPAVPTAPRKRGRPRKNPVATTEPVVAAAPRKRGRPRKNPIA